MATDVGYILFVQLLGMTQYPGSPFTGNIYRDLIMFLIVPTIFIIMVLYMMTGRVIPDRKMRIMLGVGAYLFIIASGFYPVFALLAGPYFIFLIFILGILGYLAGHFRGHNRGGGGATGFSSGGGFSGSDEKISPFAFTTKHEALRRIHYLEEENRKDTKKMESLEGKNQTDKALAQIEARIHEREQEIYNVRERMRILPG